MKGKTLIELFEDNHLVVTRMIRRADSGTAADRRAIRKARERGEEPNPWRKAARKIFRDGKTHELPFIAGVTFEEMGSNTAQAEQNEACADAYTCDAYERVQEIEARNDAFAHDPSFCKIRKVKKVVLVNEDGTVEEL